MEWGGVDTPWPVHAGIHTHPCPVHAGMHPPPTATAADGTHPTGMHSCEKYVSLAIVYHITFSGGSKISPRCVRRPFMRFHHTIY